MTGLIAGFVTLGLLLLTACGQPEARASEALGAEAAVHRVDSLIPRDEALRRFREGLPPVDSLASGATDRDSLVATFVRALETADTARLAAIAMTKSEFAYLYYPTAREGLPPYDLSPSLAWFMIFSQSERGIRRALRARGGQPLGYLDYRCDDPAVGQGNNRIWSGCAVRRRTERGDTVREVLFARILERDGRYKFLSYANRFD